ncbi:MAG: wapA, partial [Acidobacteria bacterium]|nr:wapA [Acidobacteriota bacterium]
MRHRVQSSARHARSSWLTASRLAVVVLSAAVGCQSTPESAWHPDAGATVELDSPEAAALVDRLRDRFQMPSGGPALARFHSAALSKAPVIAASTASFVVSDEEIRVAQTEQSHAGVVHAGDLRLAHDATAPFRLTDIDSGVSVEVRLAGAPHARAESARGYVVYRTGILSAPDVIYRPTAEGTEDYLHFTAPPAGHGVTYEVRLGAAVAGVRLVEGVFELLDARGMPRLRMARPFIVGNDGNRHDVTVAVDGCAIDANPDAPWNRAPIAAGADVCRVRLGWDAAALSYPALLDPTWTATGSMTTARGGHTVTQLPDKTLLVAGGASSSAVLGLQTAELYNPTTRIFAATGSMNHPHAAHVAMSYDDAVVFVGGGINERGVERWQGGSWTLVGNLSAPRSFAAVASVERLSGVWGTPARPVEYLVCGGYATGRTPSSALKSCDAINSIGVDTSVHVPDMNEARAEFTFGPTGAGRTEADGGLNGNGAAKTTEEFDTTNALNVGQGTWRTRDGSLLLRYGQAMTRIGPGILVGGYDGSAVVGSILFSDAGLWRVAGTLATPRAYTTIAVLPSGNLLIAGGATQPSPGSPFVPSALADITTPYGSPTPTVALATARFGHVSTSIADGVLVTGGIGPSGYLSSAELFREQIDNGQSCTSSSDCKSGICAGGICCATACSGACLRCDSSGTCRGCPAGAICSSANSCVAARCDTTACPAGYFCTATKECVPKLPNGSAGSAAGCVSGFAADGVCCDRACTSGCERCNVDGSVGTCKTVPAELRLTGRSSGCAAGYLCNGSPGCPSTCTVDSNCAPGYYCASSPAGCDGIWCPPGGEAIVNVSLDRSAEGNSTQPPPSVSSCVGAMERGSACTRDAQCGDGYCVGGVCCNSLCDDAATGAPSGCASCSLAGNYGTCTVASVGSCATQPLFLPSPLPRGLTSVFADVTRFLYVGANATQRMSDGSPIVSGVIRSDRAAVVRGRVLDGSSPLGGAVVSIRNHPEYGRTFTRATGDFDLAVNGGETIVVRVEAANHPISYREAVVRDHDYAALSDIALVPYAAPRAVDLRDVTQYHAVQSDVVGSGAAARRIAVLFPPGARVRMQLSTGNIDLAQPNIRITEFTKGDGDGPAMPATLPASSAYTFAADFYVEPPAALTEKPSSITFVDASGAAIALPTYIDNFLGFPVGETAPLGGYDDDAAYWRASPSGKVIRILSVTNGVASIDTVGDGQPHDADLPLGERQALGALFPGAVKRDFMRVLLPHFSDWDVNCGKVPPDDASFPPDGDPMVVGDSPDTQSCRAGSTIECQSQTLSESVPITGTPFSLVYRSDRQRSYSARRTIRIDVPPATFPASLIGVAVDIFVAGRVVKQFYPRASISPSGTLTATWDGLDAYGRALNGEVSTLVRWGYVYPSVYGRTDVFGYNGGGRITRDGGIAIPGREYITLWTKWFGLWLGTYDARNAGLRGWAIDVHHSYDMQRGALISAGDRMHLVGRTPFQIDTLLGGPNSKIAHVDYNGLNGLALGRDGSVYVTRTESESTVLWRLRDGVVGQVPLTMNGHVFTISGSYPMLTSDRDGNLYLYVSGTLYRIVLSATAASASGTVSVWADATGKCWDTDAQTGDGGLAVNALLCNIRAIAAGRDGSVYLSEGDRGRIRRIAPDGTISTIYGPSSVNPRTVTAGLPVYSLAAGDDGSLYYVQYSRIMRITPEGLIVAVTGAGTGTYDGDGIPASTATLSGVG